MESSCFSPLVARCGWSPMGFEDEPLYRDWFGIADVRGSYENSFAYYQQECRHDAAKYIGADFLATVYSRSKSSRFAILLPPLGSVRAFARSASDLCEQISAQTRRIVVLRKCTPEVADLLSASSNFVPMKPTEYDHPRELPEDIFPQVVIDTSVARTLVGPGFRKIRNHLRALEKECRVDFAPFTVEEASRAVHVVERWAAEYNRRAARMQADLALVGDNGVDPQSYTVFCDRYGSRADCTDYFGRTMYLDGELKGFSFVGRTGRSTGGLFVSLCMTRHRGASEAMLHDMVSYVEDCGIRYLNLGGSEGERLFSYKKKWGPVELRPTFELRYQPAE